MKLQFCLLFCMGVKLGCKFGNFIILLEESNCALVG